MIKPVKFLDTKWKINFILLFCSAAIYSCYFGFIFLKPNALLSSITLDSLKNYYTFLYHIKVDPDFFHFSGMNFPSGEHIVYTDCQPIITFILRLLPFTHNHLIGILHGLMFLSFIVSPLILNAILHQLHVNRLVSFFSALGIALMAPQFVKIQGGHFALAYGCIVPIAIYLLLSYLKTKSFSGALKLFLYNVFLFSLHPYLGFCGGIFTFISIFIYEFFPFKKTIVLKNTFSALLAGLLPIVLFKLFMMLTDHHQDRPTEPYGSDVLIENIGSILAPEFGPFQSLMEYLFPSRIVHYEGHTYLGFATILLSFTFLIALITFRKKIEVNKKMLAIFVASSFLLMLAFGFHNKVFQWLHINSLTFKQFRATCRFAWFFYYTLPLLVIPTLYHFTKTKLSESGLKICLATFCLLFFSVNVLEAHYFFKKDETAFWKDRNFFNPSYLNAEELETIASIKKISPQGIIPLPLFHGGTEMYDRLGSNNSMIPSMLYSYHTGIPILSSLMSRTSLTETEQSLGLLNSYKKTKTAARFLNNRPFFIIKTNDPLLPDEERLLTKVTFYAKNDSLQFGYIDKNIFLVRKSDQTALSLDAKKTQLPDSNHVIYIPHEDRKPFTGGNFKDYEHIYTLDSNLVKSGNYYVSLHHFYTNRTYRSLACDLIVTRNNKTGSEWFYVFSLRYMTGFYNGYGIVERKLFLEKNYSYEFILKGNMDVEYKISDFMLRPEGLSIITEENNKNSTINNYPIGD